MRGLFITVAGFVIIGFGCGILATNFDELECSEIVDEVLELSSEESEIQPDQPRIESLTNLRVASRDSKHLTCQGYAAYEGGGGYTTIFTMSSVDDGHLISYESRPACEDFVADVIDLQKTQVQRGLSFSEILKIRNIIEVSNIDGILTCHGDAFMDIGEEEPILFTWFADEDGDAFVTMEPR